MLVFVDYEHADAHGRDHGERVLAARTWITYRLEDVSGQPCHLVRYNRFDTSLLDRLGATALLISGNSVDPAHYHPSELEPLYEAIRYAGLPVFGFCGGLQVIARAFGAAVVPLDGSTVEDDPTVVRSPSGTVFEYGYHPIDMAEGTDEHPLFAGLGDAPVFRHAHGLHVPKPPDGFSTLASTAATSVQVMAHEERKIVGTQFHPEYWTDEHLDGRTMISNFFNWAL